MTVGTGERALLYGELLALFNAQLESIRADIAAIHQKVESFAHEVQSANRLLLEASASAVPAAEPTGEAPHLETLIDAFEQALPEVGTDIDLTSLEPTGPDAPRQLGDDFTLVCGIDAEAEETLAGFNIVHFRDLAGLDRDQAVAIGMVLGDAERVLRESWIAQADILASGGLTAYAQALLKPVPESVPSLFMPEPAPDAADPTEALATLKANGSATDVASFEAYLSHVVDAAAALAAVRAEIDNATARKAATHDAPGTATFKIGSRDTHCDGDEDIEGPAAAQVTSLEPADTEFVACPGAPEASEIPSSPDAECSTHTAVLADDAEPAAAASPATVGPIAAPASSAALATDDRTDATVIDFQSHLAVARTRRHYRPRAIAASALLLLAAGVAVGTVPGHWLTFQLTAVAQCSSELMQGNTTCVSLPASLLKMPLDVAQRLPRA